MADSWESKFPHPGSAPTKPAPKAPFDVAHAYNAWVTAMRRHNVAKAVDALIAREQASGPLDAVETIALIVGVMLLDGTIRDSPDGILGALGMF